SQGVAENRIGNNKRQNRWDPSRQKNRKDDLEPMETVAPSFRCCISQLHVCLLRKNWNITVNLLTASGKGECLRSTNAGRPLAPLFDGQFLLSDQEIGKPFATAITKIDRRLLCINTMRRRFTKANILFLN